MYNATKPHDNWNISQVCDAILAGFVTMTTRLFVTQFLHTGWRRQVINAGMMLAAASVASPVSNYCYLCLLGFTQT